MNSNQKINDACIYPIQTSLGVISSITYQSLKYNSNTYSKLEIKDMGCILLINSGISYINSYLFEKDFYKLFFFSLIGSVGILNIAEQYLIKNNHHQTEEGKQGLYPPLLTGEGEPDDDGFEIVYDK